jgi:hypothetical protein
MDTRTMNRRRLLSGTVLLTLVAAAGCQQRSPTPTAPANEGQSNADRPAAATTPANGALPADGAEPPVIADANGRVKVRNNRCPVMPEHTIKNRYPFADNVVAYKGKFIGFCCTECVESWKTMSEAERDEALGKAELTP